MRQTENQSTRQETSDDALASISGTIAREVYRAIRDQPRTVDELMRDMGLTHSTCSARVNQLMRAGWIRDSGDRRFTRSLRDAIVWVACEQQLERDDRPGPTRAEMHRRIMAALAVSESSTDRSESLERIAAILRGDDDR
jgi:predicted transcriptional regulator